MVVCLSRPSLPPHYDASEREPTRISLRTVRSPVPLSLPSPRLPPPLAYTVPGPQDGNTPLLIACENGLTEVALALVAKGANVDAADEVRSWGGG